MYNSFLRRAGVGGIQMNSVTLPYATPGHRALLASGDHWPPLVTATPLMATLTPGNSHSWPPLTPRPPHPPPIKFHIGGSYSTLQENLIPKK